MFFYEEKKLSSVDYRIVILVDLNFMGTKMSGCSKNFIYSECMSDVAGVSAFAVYMPEDH